MDEPEEIELDDDADDDADDEAVEIHHVSDSDAGTGGEDHGTG